MSSVLLHCIIGDFQCTEAGGCGYTVEESSRRGYSLQLGVSETRASQLSGPKRPVGARGPNADQHAMQEEGDSGGRSAFLSFSVSPSLSLSPSLCLVLSPSVSLRLSLSLTQPGPKIEFKASSQRFCSTN